MWTDGDQWDRVAGVAACAEVFDVAVVAGDQELDVGVVAECDDSFEEEVEHAEDCGCHLVFAGVAGEVGQEELKEGEVIAACDLHQVFGCLLRCNEGEVVTFFEKGLAGDIVGNGVVVEQVILYGDGFRLCQCHDSGDRFEATGTNLVDKIDQVCIGKAAGEPFADECFKEIVVFDDLA